MKFQQFDLKPSLPFQTTPQKTSLILLRFRTRLLLKLFIVAAPVVLLGFSASNWQPSGKAINSTPKSTQLHYPLILPEPTDTILNINFKQPKTNGSDRHNQWRTITIKPGDTLASIFAKNHLPAKTTHAVATLNEQTKSLRNIRSGQKIHLLLDDEGLLKQMQYDFNVTKSLLIQHTEEQDFYSQIINYQLDAYPVYREGVINSSLFEAATKNDIPDKVIMDLADVFGWDIDFSLDIRKGDRFSIVYNELYKEDTKVRSGRILAAEFINKGKIYRAIYYTDPAGNSDYFDASGKSMRKAFLRSPVKFSRISSKFSKKRWHPILSKWRSHKGVDYAAARGTPVLAAGDGKVSFAGTKNGYGHTVFIEHGNRYTTVYGHLHDYAKGMHTGTQVKQGEIIGYVGSSGMATGPHLHYEFRVNNSHRDPLTVQLPEAKPIQTAYQEDFKEKANIYLSMLHLMGTAVAANQY